MHKQKGETDRRWLWLLAFAAATAQADAPAVSQPIYLGATASDDSGAALKEMDFTPSGCTYHHLVIGRGLSVREAYPCSLVSGTAPTANVGQGSFAVRFDLPGGSVTQAFVIRYGTVHLDTSTTQAWLPFDYTDALTHRGAPLDLGTAVAQEPPKPKNIYKPAPPQMAQGANGAFAVAAPTEYMYGSGPTEEAYEGRVKGPISFKLRGFDCSLQQAGKAAFPCIPAEVWAPDHVSLLVSGAAFGSALPIVNVRLNRQGGGWEFDFIYLNPQATDPLAGYLVVPAAVTRGQAARPVLIMQHYRSYPRYPADAVPGILDLMINGKDCMLRDLLVESWGHTTRSATYACEVIGQKPGNSNGYDLLLDLPQGKRFLSVAGGAGQTPPADVPVFERTTGWSSSDDRLPGFALDLPGEKPARIEVNGLDCSVTAAGHGSLPCWVDRWSDTSFRIGISGIFARADRPYGAMYVDGRSLVAATALQLVNGVIVQSGFRLDTWFDPPPSVQPRPRNRTTYPNDNRPELMIAIGAHDADWVRDLIAQGADVNAVANSGGGDYTALQYAVRNGGPEIALLLVDAGADVNAVDHGGDSILNEAVRFRQDDYRDVIMALVLHGADVNHVGGDGMTPIRVAKRSGNEYIVDFLSAHGGRYTPADLAQDSADNAKALAYVTAMGGPKAAVEFINGPPKPKPPAEPGVKDQSRLGFHASAAPGLVSYTGQPGAAFGGETVTVTDLHNGQHATQDVRPDGSLWVDVPGAIDDFYAIEFDVPGKRGTPSYQRGSDPALALKGVMPDPDANGVDVVIYGNDATFMGSYAGSADVGVTVGGRAAMLDHGIFLARHVSLKPGEDSVEMTITALGGRRLTRKIQVKAGAAWPLQLYSETPPGATDPLTMAFGYRTAPGITLKSLTLSTGWGDLSDITLDDPATLAAAATGAPAAITRRYPAHGLYPVWLKATGSQGDSYTLEQPVLVPDPAEMDATLTEAWQYFLAALASGDRRAAVSALSAGGQKRLDGAVTGFMRHPDTLPSGSLPLARESCSGDTATYRVGPPGPAAPHVTFKRDPDGVWRIDSM